MNNRYILTFIAVFFSLAGVAKVSHPFSNKIIESADDIIADIEQALANK